MWFLLWTVMKALGASPQTDVLECAEVGAFLQRLSGLNQLEFSAVVSAPSQLPLFETLPNRES